MAGPYTPPQEPTQYPADIEFIRGLVGKHFPIYETRVTYDTVSLSCNVDPQRLEQDFDNLRKEMRLHNYVPILTYERGEHQVHVVRTPPLKPTGAWVNVIFFFVTVATTIIAGASLWYGYTGATGSVWASEILMMGFLTFALPLLVILGAHELSHYYAAKRHGVAASMPFFIPSFPPLGTFGAFISIREPIPSRKALLDIGAAGPIASFLLAIPMTMAGLALTGAGSGNEIVNSGGSTFIGPSVFYEALMAFAPIPGNRVIHPLAFAGWVGLFVTAINLLPAGQLDGGHIARALLGSSAKWASYAAMGLLVFLGIFLYFGWLIFAVLIFFMGIRHPPPLNDVTRLGDSRKYVGAALAVVLVLCFVPVPMGEIQSEYGFEFTDNLAPDADNVVILRNAAVNLSAQSTASKSTYTMAVVNTGNTWLSVNVTASLNRTMLTQGWNVLVSSSEPEGTNETATLGLNSGDYATVNVTFIIPPGFAGTEHVQLTGQAKSDSGGSIRDENAVNFGLVSS
ncbi:MAG: site-2 protease family protein [Methanobacteriota archaeon]